MKILISGSSLDFDSLLSDREKEIVQHMSEGNDAFEIAERLFISEIQCAPTEKIFWQKQAQRIRCTWYGWPWPTVGFNFLRFSYHRWCSSPTILCLCSSSICW
ncbi:MAG: helix-turn-helix transcriptional regulator [Bacteroidetes bacterium]|nr:helix-turn-helix transcriptional regulator [Bacteroidota bacterium]